MKQLFNSMKCKFKGHKWSEETFSCPYTMQTYKVCINCQLVALSENIL